MTDEPLPVCDVCGGELVRVEILNRAHVVCFADPFGHKAAEDNREAARLPYQEPSFKASKRFYCNPQQTPARLKKWMEKRYDAIVNETTDEDGSPFRHTVLQPKLGVSAPVVRSTPKKRRASLLILSVPFGQPSRVAKEVTMHSTGASFDGERLFVLPEHAGETAAQFHNAAQDYRERGANALALQAEALAGAVRRESTR